MQEAIIFATSELCSHVDGVRQQQLIDDLYADLRQAIIKQRTPRLLNLLTLMRLYFQKMLLDTVIAGQKLTIESLELIAYRGPDADQVYSELGRFLQVMLNISKDEHAGGLMRSIYDTLKRVINENKFYAGIENKETIGAFVRLITSVLEVCNSDVSIMALKCLKFLVTKIDKSFLTEHSTAVYGVLLRTLSYKYALIALSSDIQMNLPCTPSKC